jgi:flagellar biosynthesis protein FlhG
MHRSDERARPLAGLAAPERLAGAPRIWAIGGGKGGVGKSVVASGLAGALAGSGRRCTLIDADFGGANLHTLLGVSRPRYTLSHFLSGEVDSLADLVVETSVPDLTLVSGNEALLEMANPKHCQKEKLFRHVRGLDVDEVVLDLGGGSAFNVLDSFLIARRGLVVITSEPTAIENAEHFLRAAFYRSLRAVTRRPEVRAAIQRVKEDRRRSPVRSAQELIARVKRIDPPAAKLLAESAQAFAPLLVVNRVANGEDERVGPELAARCRERLGVSIEYAGCLSADPHVAEAIARRRPAAQLFSRCAFSRQIEVLARELLREDWELPRERSAAPTRSRRRNEAPTRTLAGAQRALPALDLLAPGDYLRRCRNSLKLSLREMIERTRIQALDDIEHERFAALPPEPYLKGFVLEYARELGIPELEALVSSYLERYRRAVSKSRR